MKRASLSETVFTDVDNATYSKLIDVTSGTIRVSAHENNLYQHAYGDH